MKLIKIIGLFFLTLSFIHAHGHHIEGRLSQETQTESVSCLAEATVNSDNLPTVDLPITFLTMFMQAHQEEKPRDMAREIEIPPEERIMSRVLPKTKYVC